MLTEEQLKLWDEYLKKEEDRIHPLLTEALERFVASVEVTPIEQWSEWAFSLCERVVDEGENIPVRFPLFRRVLFPALLAGYQTQIPKCARWLAGFHTLLYHSSACREQLGEENLGQIALLKTALTQDPNDEISRNWLIRILADTFVYTLHELPIGVLYNQYLANIGQCLELVSKLEEFHQLVRVAGLEDRYIDLINDCRSHYSAYRDYLQRQPEFQSYEAYLRHHNINSKNYL